MHSDKPIRWDVLATIVAVVIAGLWAARIAIFENHAEDLWIYSSGGWFGFHGQTPYETERIHDRVAQQYPENEKVINNCGFFLTPQAMLPFAPFAYLPWLLAKLLWCAITIAMAAVAAWQFRYFTATPPPIWFTGAAVVAMLLNSMSLFVLIVGQTPLLIVSCVLLGQMAFANGRPRLAGFLWGLAFMKPHIALPLIVVAWCISGWQRAAEVVAWAIALNVFAGLATVGDPLMIREYLEYIPKGHKSVEFNRISVNKQITSWNRLLFANGGPTIELGAVGTFAGYAVWFALAALRCLWQRAWPTASWVLAMAACGAVLCCQLLPYELPLLMLVIPYLWDLIARGRRTDVIVVVLIVLLGAYALPGGEGSLPEWVAYNIGGAIDRLAAWLGATISTTTVLLSHRSLSVMCLAITVLGYGSIRPKVN